MVTSTNGAIKLLRCDAPSVLSCIRLFFCPCMGGIRCLCVRGKDAIMKAAEKNITAGANDIIRKYTKNAVIRMSDFYPDAVGGQEYCTVGREVYAELLRFKAVEEEAEGEIPTPESVPTVIIRVKDFYPHSRSGEEYREISRGKFDRLMAKLGGKTRNEEDEGSEDEKGEKVVVRTKDFYPLLCSEKEYTELDRHTYELLLKYKASGEYEGNIVTPFSEPTASVKVNVKSYFPDADTEENDVSIEIYEELLRYRAFEQEYKEAAKSDTVRIRVADFYPNNCCDEEYCDVSREVYEQLMNDKKEDHAIRVKDSRYLINYCFDEIQCGEEESKYTESNSSAILMTLWLRKIFRQNREHLYRRAVMYFVNGYSADVIAMLEGVSRRAVNKSIAIVNSVVKMHKNEFVRNCVNV